MADFPGQNEFFDLGKREIITRNAAISPEIVDREGSDANALVALAAAMADEVVTQLVGVEEGIFLDSARDEKLDRLLFDRYALRRPQASPSLGSVEFSTTAAAAQSFNIDAGTLLQSTEGVQFVTQVAFTFPQNTTGPHAVAVRSVLAGLTQRAKAGTITSILSKITNAPTGLAVTNSKATSGGDERQSNEAFREVGRLFWTTAQRGTLGALERRALQVAGVRKARAIEVLDALGRPARLVTLIIADAFTEQFATFSAVPPTYATQSQQLAVSVQNALSDTRAAGIYVQVLVAKVVLQAVRLDLKFVAGANIDDAAFRARVAVVNYTNERKPGETWSRVAAGDALKSVSGLIITGSEIASPVGDVVPKPLEVIRSSLQLVTAGSVQSDQVLTNTANPDAYVLT